MHVRPTLASKVTSTLSPGGSTSTPSTSSPHSVELDGDTYRCVMYDSESFSNVKSRGSASTACASTITRPNPTVVASSPTLNHRFGIPTDRPPSEDPPGARLGLEHPYPGESSACRSGRERVAARPPEGPATIAAFWGHL